MGARTPHTLLHLAPLDRETQYDRGFSVRAQGVPASMDPRLRERAPHPDPLPASAGRGSKPNRGDA